MYNVLMGTLNTTHSLTVMMMIGELLIVMMVMMVMFSLGCCTAAECLVN